MANGMIFQKELDPKWPILIGKLSRSIYKGQIEHIENYDNPRMAHIRRFYRNVSRWPFVAY
jgi:hypothetical protein